MDTIISAGIDIGTTTTQVVFSRLRIENTGGFGQVPRYIICSKEIVYRGQVHFTPLLPGGLIDAERVRTLVLDEYQRAGYQPRQITTGAVIITGETSRKKNAQVVLNAIADVAGDFVSAVAGPDLESVLAGKGSGAYALSCQTDELVANLDIGGGTTNIACFRNGRIAGTACYDIGARLVRLENGVVKEITPGLQRLTQAHGIDIPLGQRLAPEKAEEVCSLLVNILEQAVGLAKATDDLTLMQTNHGLPKNILPRWFTLSGGVTACLQTTDLPDFAYDDLGVIFARKLLRSRFFLQEKTRIASETLRATVVGAGCYSMDVSGSTITYQNCRFPYKNYPVLKLPLSKAEDIGELKDAIRESVRHFYLDTGGYRFALAWEGLSCPSFLQIEETAQAIAEGCGDLFSGETGMILMVHDSAKALGQALLRRLGKTCSLLCIDGVRCETGDYVDVGSPLSGGSVVPVVVKTLLFDHEEKG